MRIFGRKANQQSTTPSAAQVPPELQPYYGRPSLGTRLRRVGLFILPVLAALALIAALIAGGMWLKHRSDDSNHKVVAKSPTIQVPTTNNNQYQGNAQSQPTEPQPANTAPGANSVSSPSDQSSTNIPSTGPSSSVYVLALIAAVFGTAAAYIRQLKIARR
jgi:hypothetical protein